MKKELKISPLHCFRCKKDFYPSLDSKTGKTVEQSTCSHCNSKYWRKPVERKAVSKMMKQLKK